MNSGSPPDAAASTPREEGNAARRRRRITYSAEFLLSVAGSDTCKDLPAGVDASALSELNQAAPPARWDAFSSGSPHRQGDLPDREPDQPDRHPGNQFRHNWHHTEHDGLLGSGASPRPPCFVGSLASNDQGSGYQLNRNSGLYQPPRPYKNDVDSINDQTFGSFECSYKGRVEEERKRRASFESTRKDQQKVLQEKKTAPDSDKENFGDGIISLLQDSAGKRGPPTKSDKKDELKASCLSKDVIKTSPLLPTPNTRPLKPPGFVNAFSGKRLQLQFLNTSLISENVRRQLNVNEVYLKIFENRHFDWYLLIQIFEEETQQLNADDITISSVPESSERAKWFLDEVGSGHTEDLSSKNLISMIVKDENLLADNLVRGPSASGDNLEKHSPRSPSNCGAGSKLRFISPAPAAGTLHSTDDIPESVPVMTCGDLEETMLSHVNDSSIPNRENMVHEYQTSPNQPSAAEPIDVDQHASQRILSLLQKGRNSNDSSLEFHMGSTDELLSSNPNGMVNGEVTTSDPVKKTETSLTVEALFGAASMNGLHSGDSSVSVREHTTGGLNSSSKSLLFSEEWKNISSSIPDDRHGGEQTVLFSHSKSGAFHMKPETGVEYGNLKFSGSSREGATFDEKSLEIQLPEEDDLFSVNDSLHAQNTHRLPFAESARPGLLPVKEVADLNYRFQSLAVGEAEHIQLPGQDMLGSCSHDRRDQVDPNNLYHLFGSPSAKSPINSASTMFPPMDHIADWNQEAPFNMPEAIPCFTRSFPQSMNSMQHVLPAPCGPHVDPIAHHHVLRHMSMQGSFAPQGLPRGASLSQPARRMAGYRTEMNNVNSFKMHLRQPSYGEPRMMMAGPPGPEVAGFSHAGALERLIQMELRARSRQIHPAMAGGPAQGLYGPEFGMNFRY